MTAILHVDNSRVLNRRLKVHEMHYVPIDDEEQHTLRDAKVHTVFDACDNIRYTDIVLRVALRFPDDNILDKLTSDEASNPVYVKRYTPHEKVNAVAYDECDRHRKWTNDNALFDYTRNGGVNVWMSKHEIIDPYSNVMLCTINVNIIDIASVDENKENENDEEDVAEKTRDDLQNNVVENNSNTHIENDDVAEDNNNNNDDDVYVYNDLVNDEYDLENDDDDDDDDEYVYNNNDNDSKDDYLNNNNYDDEAALHDRLFADDVCISPYVNVDGYSARDTLCDCVEYVREYTRALYGFDVIVNDDAGNYMMLKSNEYREQLHYAEHVFMNAHLCCIMCDIDYKVCNEEYPMTKVYAYPINFSQMYSVVVYGDEDRKASDVVTKTVSMYDIKFSARKFAVTDKAHDGVNSDIRYYMPSNPKKYNERMDYIVEVMKNDSQNMYMMMLSDKLYAVARNCLKTYRSNFFINS